MPVYLFTFHAHRSWMPDHRRGYTKRKKGYLPPDPAMARMYENRANQDPSSFDPEVQRSLLARLREACTHLNCRFHGGATEEGHIHGLVSWKQVRGWLSIRTSIKTSLSRHLHEKHPGTELSRGASRKHVKDQRH